MKLQRYDVKDGGYEKAAEFGTYCLSDDVESLEAENALLRELLGAWYGDVSIPGPNCSCHISPPCNGCVEWGGLREAAEQTKRILGVKS